MDSWFNGNITTIDALNQALMDTMEGEGDSFKMKPEVAKRCGEKLFPKGYPVTLLFVDEARNTVFGVDAHVVMSAWGEYKGKQTIRYDLALEISPDSVYRSIIKEVYADVIPLTTKEPGPAPAIGLVPMGELAQVARAMSSQSKPKGKLTLVK